MAGSPVPSDKLNKLMATLGSDTILGSNGHDYVFADKGNDRIKMGAGHDFVDAGYGRDTIFGGDGDDTINPEGEAFWSDVSTYQAAIAAGEFDDVVYAGNGNDLVSNSPGNDVIYLGAGDDVYIINWAFGAGTYLYYTNPGRDTIYGGAGNDKIEGHTVYGGTGADKLYEVHDFGDKRASKLYGDDGNDEIHASHNAFVSGGRGNDRIEINYETAISSLGDFTGVQTTYSPTGKNVIYGGSGDDTILRVASGGNKIWGGFGKDHIGSLSSPLGEYDDVPKWLGGDRFLFAKGHAKGGDTIDGFQIGADKIDLSGYDLNGDGTGDLKKADIKLIDVSDTVTEIWFKGEHVSVTSTDNLSMSDILF